MKYKNIYIPADTDKSGKTIDAILHYLVGYCPQTLESYMGMINEVKKSFPEIDENKVELGRVTQSDYCKGFTIISCQISIPNEEYVNYQKYKGCSIHNGFCPNYYW